MIRHSSCVAWPYERALRLVPRMNIVPCHQKRNFHDRHLRRGPFGYVKMVDELPAALIADCPLSCPRQRQRETFKAGSGTKGGVLRIVGGVVEVAHGDKAAACAPY